MPHPVAEYLHELYLMSDVREGVTSFEFGADSKDRDELAVKDAGGPDESDSKVVRTVPCAADRKSSGKPTAQRTVRTTLSPDLDTHLNATTRWKDVPEAVWAYTLGGYQVLKKWLSYRESALLGRPLTPDEAQHFTHHVRRITAILALHEKLDAHYGASV